jgi:methionine sulfoxide reductase heme-binding subunit
VLTHPGTRTVVFALCLLPAALLTLDWLAELGVIGWWTSSLAADQIHDTQIRTGLWTLRFLAITLAVTPVRELLGLGALVRYRRTFGLFAFFYATVHLATWTWADTNFDLPFMWREIVKHKYILVGMLTWLLLLPLAVTSTKGWIRRLGGKRWNRLHRLIYVAAVTGTIHYLWAVKKDTLFPAVYFVVFAVLLSYRVVRARTSREQSRRGRLAT